MDDENYAKAMGCATAAMHLHVVTVSLLLKYKLMHPQIIREALDGALFLFEQQQGGAAPIEARAAQYAQAQLRMLLTALETTSPEMRSDQPQP